MEPMLRLQYYNKNVNLIDLLKKNKNNSCRSKIQSVQT